MVRAGFARLKKLMAQTRITAGEYRSRVLATPSGPGTRPSTSRVREALFNIIGNDIAGAVVIDLFAGAGTIGFEALSRGAARVTFVEHERLAIEAITASAGAFGCADRCRIVRSDVGRWVAVAAAEIVAADVCFLDAPYGERSVDGVMAALATGPPRLVVCEHHRARRLEERIGGLERIREARYGLAHLSFYRPSVARVDTGAAT